MSDGLTTLKRFKPAVTKGVRLFLAGGLWCCVGSMLLCLAATWFRETPAEQRYLLMGGGLLFGLFMHHFVFLKMVNKNLARILPVEEKRCLFSFMPWKSYLIIPVMIGMGMLLRRSSFPKPYLAVIYMGIGLALLLSSIRYARHFVLHRWNSL